MEENKKSLRKSNDFDLTLEKKKKKKHLYIQMNKNDCSPLLQYG